MLLTTTIFQLLASCLPWVIFASLFSGFQLDNPRVVNVSSYAALSSAKKMA